MKLIFATALAVIAMPALAQDMPAPTPPAPQTAPMPPAPPPSADPAAAPAPMAAPAAPAAPMPMAAPMPPEPAAATGPYPMCSKTVTDHCTERSNAKGERLRSTPRG